MASRWPGGEIPRQQQAWDQPSEHLALQTAAHEKQAHMLLNYSGLFPEGGFPPTYYKFTLADPFQGHPYEAQCLPG